MAKTVKKSKKKSKKKTPKKVRKKVLKGEVQVRRRSPDAQKPLNRRGREILLNDEMLAKMILLWRYGVSNERIARILGIGFSAFKKWVSDNRPVEILLIDDPINRPKLSRKVIVGLRDLMDHEKGNLKANYIQRLEELIEEAKSEGDLKTAGNLLRWMAEKMLPYVFGDPRLRPEGDPNEPKRVNYPLRPPSMD